MDASCEELDLDPNLGFLDAYVARALAAGAAPYISEEERFRMGVRQHALGRRKGFEGKRVKIRRNSKGGIHH